MLPTQIISGCAKYICYGRTFFSFQSFFPAQYVSPSPPLPLFPPTLKRSDGPALLNDVGIKEIVQTVRPTFVHFDKDTTWAILPICRIKGHRDSAKHQSIFFFLSQIIGHKIAPNLAWHIIPQFIWRNFYITLPVYSMHLDEEKVRR